MILEIEILVEHRRGAGGRLRRSGQRSTSPSHMTAIMVSGAIGDLRPHVECTERLQPSCSRVTFLIAPA